MQKFTTNRLSVRELQSGDCPALLAIYNCQQNMEFISSGKSIWSELELREKLEEFNINYSKGYGIYVVEAKESGVIIGEAGLFNSFDSERVLELGYILDVNYWGRGLATELLAGLIVYGFEVLHLHKVVARMHAGNLASARVCEKCGMRLVMRGVSKSGSEYFRYEISRE